MADAAEQNEVKAEGLENFLRQYRPGHVLERERDTLSGRYRILVNEPLQQFSSVMADAFAVRDTESGNSSLYALVFKPDALLRKKNIATLKEYRHPNLVSLLDEGKAEISLYSETRYVIILERPVGQRLSDLLSVSKKNPVTDTTITQYVIRPLAEILKAFAAMGISHGRINLHNVYLNNATLHLGECVSDPSGYSQHYLFETIDRNLTSPWAKADYAIDADCYALGLLSLHLMLGHQPFAKMTREELIESLLTKGSYHTLVIQWDVADQFIDLFRALLNDAKRERCTPEALEHWLSGRRFNLILPSPTQETARGFEFAGKTYHNRKSLAQAMFEHWDEAKELLFDTQLTRWLETSIHRKDVADIVSRIASNNMGNTLKAERHNSELLTRILTVLDPSGPIRFKTLSFTAEGIGNLLAHLYFSGDQESLVILLQAIDGDISAQWFEQQKSSGTDHTPLIGRLQKTRNFLRQRVQGFGVERCLYDLHPYLPCQSELVRRFCVTTLRELITALDMASANPRVFANDFMDSHLAAFAASKLELNKEMRVHELDSVRDLASHSGLIALKLLARAQSISKSPEANGLTHWISLQLFPLFDRIHRRTIRQKIKGQLVEAAQSGRIGYIADVMLNPNLFVADHQGFQRASALYAARKYQIAKLNDPRERARHARMVGRGLAQTLAYGTSLFTIYFTLRSYYHI